MKTFRKDSKIQSAFDGGYAASVDTINPFIWSSTLWEAFELGRFFNLNGIESDLVAPSRGHSFRTARLSVFRLTYSGACIAIAETCVAQRTESEPLLAALESLLSQIEEEVPQASVTRHFHDALDDARAVIANAKGGAQ